MKKRILTMLLAALLTASTVSCGKPEQVQETTADTTAVIKTTEETETQIGTSSNVNFLPITCSDPDLSCRVMETLACHSMLNVVPTYYTVALENKYTRDEDVPEMLALIREGMTMNFDFAFSTSPNMAGTNVVFMRANGNISSHMASMTKVWTAGIEKLITGLE